MTNFLRELAESGRSIGHGEQIDEAIGGLSEEASRWFHDNGVLVLN